MGECTPWVQLVGSVLAHAGIGGFLENLDELRDTTDDEAAEWEAFLERWYLELGDTYYSVADLASQLTVTAEQHALLPAAARRRPGQRQLGHSTRIAAPKSPRAVLRRSGMAGDARDKATIRKPNLGG